MDNVRYLPPDEKKTSDIIKLLQFTSSNLERGTLVDCSQPIGARPAWKRTHIVEEFQFHSRCGEASSDKGWFTRHNVQWSYGSWVFARGARIRLTLCTYGLKRFQGTSHETSHCISSSLRPLLPRCARSTSLENLICFPTVEPDAIILATCTIMQQTLGEQRVCVQTRKKLGAGSNKP